MKQEREIKKEIKEFVSFLKRNDAYAKYLVNYMGHRKKHLLRPKPPSFLSVKEWILYGFTWCQTKEGTEFWNDLNSAWVSKCNAMKFL